MKSRMAIIGKLKVMANWVPRERSDKGRMVMKLYKVPIEKLVRVRAEHESIIIEKLDKLKTVKKSDEFYVRRHSEKSKVTKKILWASKN